MGPDLGTMLGTITPWGARGGGTVTTWCRPACINPQTARSPMNTASRSRLAIPATQTLPWSRGFKLTHYIAHAPSGARPCAATARDPRRSLRDRDRCKPGGWPTPRGAELGRRDLGPAAEPRGSLGAGRRSGRAKTRVEAGAERRQAGRRRPGRAAEPRWRWTRSPRSGRAPDGARARTPAPTAGGGRARERSRRPTGSGGIGAAQRPTGASTGRAPSNLLTPAKPVVT